MSMRDVGEKGKNYARCRTADDDHHVARYISFIFTIINTKHHQKRRKKSEITSKLSSSSAS